MNKILFSVVMVLLVACATGPGSSSSTADDAVVDPRAARLTDVNPADAKAMDASATSSERREVAYLAGGCFWGMEEILRGIPGVLDTQVGYAGGNTSGPSYDDVRTGVTGHAETVRVVFDPTQLPYADLLEKWFFRMHDPTTKNRQGNDIGTQYRSAIFVTSAQQGRTARAVIAKVDKSGKWKSPIVTAVGDAGPFTTAEAYHQDYLQANPNGYTCHYLRD